MIHIVEFLQRNLETTGLIMESGYDTSFKTSDEYIEYFRQKYKKFDANDEEFVRFVMDEIWNQEPETVPFRIDKTKTSVKLYRPYRDNEKLVEWLRAHGVSDISGRSIKPGHITFEWGSGSLDSTKEGSGKIATDIQETITCVIFNEYVTKQGELSEASIKENPSRWTPYEKYFTDKSYKTWIKTWYNQCINIFNSMPKSNDLVAVHYADKDDKVAVTLRKVHSVICSARGLKSKDAFDPTDIILYSKSASGKIVSAFTDALNIDDVEAMVAALRVAITELYNDGSYVGVSLKKGTSFRPHFMNFEPAIGFENASFNGKISMDPIYGFFGDDKNAIDEFMKMTSVDKAYYKDIVKTYGRKRNKSCVVGVDCSDEKNIKFNIRTNQSTYHPLLVLEPSLHKAMAQMGKVPVEKWQSLLSQSNPSIRGIEKIKTYDIKDLTMKFEVIKNKFQGIQTTSDQLTHLFELFGDHEKDFNMDNELWAYFLEINILYAIINSNDPSKTLRTLLLWSEKMGDDCLPYLLIMPVGK